jgi:catechol 2,3-dioxygenase-like lactoylglutathione lyase family enzyme
MTISLRGFDHVGLTVPDLEEAAGLLVSVFGATELYRFGRENDPVLMQTAIGVHPEASFRAAMLELTPSVCVELFEWQSPDQDAHMPSPADVGGHHLCVVVDDFDEAVAMLRDRPDVRVYGDGGRLGLGRHAGARWIYVRTRWGLQIELIGSHA